MDVDLVAEATENINCFSELTEEGIVVKLIKFAKLNPEELCPEVQQVYFSNNINTDSIKLLELNEETLAILENGGKLVAKGTDADSCVICTDKHTFEVKDTQTTNSVLLVPGLTTATPDSKCSASDGVYLKRVEVQEVCHSYLELKRISPDLGVLYNLLKPDEYRGPETELSNRRYTFDDICSEVCASKEEIGKALKDLGAIELDGFVRLLDFNYLSRVVCSITALIEENSWYYDRFSSRKTVDVLSELYPSRILEHVLSLYGSVTNSDESSGDWCLSEDKICRFFGELLLMPTKSFNLKEFMEAWKLSVLEGMLPTLDHIKGLAFVDHGTEPTIIRYLPESTLSADIKKRFDELFTVKEYWTMEELKPYVEPLCVGKMTISALVTKHTRAFNKNGIKHFTRKHVSSA